MTNILKIYFSFRRKNENSLKVVTFPEDASVGKRSSNAYPTSFGVADEIREITANCTTQLKQNFV